MTHRSDDAKPGDRVKLLMDEESIWNGMVGTVRNVYKQRRFEKLTISVVVHPLDASEIIRNTVPKSPDGGYHILVSADEFEIIQRTVFG